MGKSRILVVGGTGYIGKFIVKASVRLGHPTFVLVRPNRSGAPVDVSRIMILGTFQSMGVTILHGDIYDRVSLVEALRHVDVVISAVGVSELLDGQLNLINAIKEVGHIKRFLPSEFGMDVERILSKPLPAVEPIFIAKQKVRQAIQETAIPYTYINSSSFAGFLVDNLGQVDSILKFRLNGIGIPPRDKVTILGSGEAKTVIVTEFDIGTATIKAVDDPHTLNKQLVIRPRKNVLSFNSLVALWEKKLGHSLEKSYLSEAQVLQKIEDLGPPANLTLGVMWEIMNGAEVFELGPKDVDAIELYPDLKYVSVDDYMSKFL